LTAALVRLEPWAESDLDLVEKLNTPAMTEHLGGPEPAGKVLERQARYAGLAASGRGRVSKIIDVESGHPAGSVAYWERSWGGEECYEMGWMVLPEFQGRGLASAGVAMALEQMRAERKHRFVHAFPSVDNAPSNGICRKAGFTLIDEVDFEYPPGHQMRCNDWRYDLAPIA